MPCSRQAGCGAALLATLVLLLGGCGGESGQGSASGAGPGLGLQINLADCEDWNAAPTETRLATIGQIRRFVGGSVQGTGGTGVVLEDERAYDLFENYCQNEFARGFKLYKLYSRAAAFSEL